MATDSMPDMATVTRQLLEHTPKTSLDRPVTEIVIFKLLPQLVPPSPQTLATIENDFISNTFGGKGMRRTAWGPSLSDPATIIIMFDWRKIQDHWDFWATPAFTPVMRTISAVFEAGRPLVRHYDFGGPGMLTHKWQRVVVWDNVEDAKSESEMRAQVGIKDQGQAWDQCQGGFAVDVGEMSWYCVTLGYDSEGKMKRDDQVLTAKGETHMIKPTIVKGKNEEQ